MFKKEIYGKNNTRSLKEVTVLFFFILVVLIVIFIESLILSRIRIEISNFKFSTDRFLGKLIDDNFSITIYLVILRKIKVLNIKITKEKIQKIQIREKLIINFNIKKIKNSNLDVYTLKKIKRFFPKINYINLLIDIGTEDAIYTSYIVAIISSLIGILLKKQFENNNNKYIINPIYINKNILKLDLNCIFEIKLIHIICIIYILNKKRRDDKNGRTSHRRSYGYSYE